MPTLAIHFTSHITPDPLPYSNTHTRFLSLRVCTTYVAEARQRGCLNTVRPLTPDRPRPYFPRFPCKPPVPPSRIDGPVGCLSSTLRPGWHRRTWTRRAQPGPEPRDPETLPISRHQTGPLHAWAWHVVRKLTLLGGCFSQGSTLSRESPNLPSFCVSSSACRSRRRRRHRRRRLAPTDRSDRQRPGCQGSLRSLTPSQPACCPLLSPLFSPCSRLLACCSLPSASPPRHHGSGRGTHFPFLPCKRRFVLLGICSSE